MPQQQSSPAKFTCDSCGRSYSWKTELAGRKVKCKCGHVLEVPASPLQAEAEGDLYGLADEPASGAKKAAPAAAAPVVPQSNTGYRCPNCLGDLVPGTHVCKACGFNLRTGAIERARKSNAGAATAMATGRRNPLGGSAVAKAAPARKLSPKEKLKADEEKARTMKQVGIGALVLLLVVGGIFGAKTFLKGGGEKAKSNLPGDDAEVEELMAESSPVEAKKFLEDHDSRSIGVQWTRSRGFGFIANQYQMGAVKVWAFADGLIASRLVVELPADAEKRAALFNYAKTHETERMMPAPKDVGQKYIILHVM